MLPFRLRRPSAYYNTFKQLVSDLRRDLDAPDLPVFVPAHMNDEDLLKTALSKVSDAALQKVKKPAGKTLVKQDELLDFFYHSLCGGRVLQKEIVATPSAQNETLK